MTKLFICPKTITGNACPAIVFDFRRENWAAGCIEYDQKEYGVDCFLRGTVARSLLWRNEEGEGVSKAIVEELGVWSVVATFVRLVLLAEDLESRPAGQLLSVENGMLCSAITISEHKHDGIRDVHVVEIEASG